MNNYYAVKKGRHTGIFKTWDECKKEVIGYQNAEYKKFNNINDAINYLNGKNLEKEKVNKIMNDYKLLKFKNNINTINLYNIKKFNNEYYIFTDGSKQKNRFAYGVYFGNDKSNIQTNINHYLYYELSNINEKTNNIAELKAIESALYIILINKNYFNGKINIVSDSKYSINCVNLWIKKWKINNWKTSNGDNVKNKNIIISIDKLLSEIKNNNFNLNFIHQMAHKSKPNNNKKSSEYYMWYGNNMIDYLVQKAIY